MLDDQPQGVRAAADGLDQPAAATCRRWPATVSADGSEQLVDGVGVDPQQDQGLVQRHGVAERLQDRAVEAHQREAVEPVQPERLQGQRPVVVERPQGLAQVGRAVLQADEVEHHQRVDESSGSPDHRSTSSVTPAGSARTSGRALGYRAATRRCAGESRAISAIRIARSVSSARFRPKYSRQCSSNSAAASSVRQSRSLGSRWGTSR